MELMALATVKEIKEGLSSRINSLRLLSNSLGAGISAIFHLARWGIMRTKLSSRMRLLSILAALLLSSWLAPGAVYSEETVAVVQDLEGDVTAYQGSFMGIKKLEKGSKIGQFSIVNTGGKSKLLLRWEQGLLTSLGESSSISSAGEGGTGQTSRIQLIQGIVRFSIDKDVSNSAFSYSVSTPLVSIQPEAVDQPVDYMVEVIDPSSTVLTVLSGKVRVDHQTAGTSDESVYESCRTVYFMEGKKPEVVTASADDVMKFIAQTTLAGTISAPDTCPGPIAGGTAPGLRAMLWMSREGRNGGPWFLPVGQKF